MRIKILIIGDDPSSVVADSQLLRDRGMLVFTTFNMQNIPELIREIKPNILFFDAQSDKGQIVDTYNDIVNSMNFTQLPVIYTLSEDDVYLVTRKRTELKEKRNLIADNIIDAIKLSLQSNKAHHKKDGNTLVINNPVVSQLQLPIFQ